MVTINLFFFNVKRRLNLENRFPNETRICPFLRPPHLNSIDIIKESFFVRMCIHKNEPQGLILITILIFNSENLFSL